MRSPLSLRPAVAFVSVCKPKGSLQVVQRIKEKKVNVDGPSLSALPKGNWELICGDAYFQHQVLRSQEFILLNVLKRPQFLLV